MSLTSLLRSRLAFAGVAFAAAGAIVASTWLTSADAETTDVSTASTAQAMRIGLAVADESSGDDTGKDRSDLRDDLKKARGLEGQARVAALEKIRAAVRDGEYGERPEHRFDRRHDRRAAVLALLPDALQDDLAELRDTDDADDRKKMREDIREKALDGGYGEKVQDAAKIMSERWDEAGTKG